MQQKRLAITHIALWLAYYSYRLLNVVFFQPYEQTNIRIHASLVFSYTVSLACSFYYCYLLVLPALVRKKQLLLYLAAVCAPLVFVSCRYLLEELLYPLLLGFRNYGTATSVSYYVLDNIYRGLPTIAVAAAIWGMRRAHRQELAYVRLQREKILAEQAFLRSQVTPHFLFNTLNYLYSCAYPVSSALGAAILRLSDMMRYAAKESSDGKVALAEEADYVDNYIEIFRLRAGDAISVVFHKHIADNSIRVMPLVLIPLVENAFKHGVLTEAENPVEIELAADDLSLHFSIVNKINVTPSDASDGIGLDNLRRRLALFYPGTHQLTTTVDEMYFKCSLDINFASRTFSKNPA